MNTAWMQAHGCSHQAASWILLLATYDVQIRDADHTACVIDLGEQVITYPVPLTATIVQDILTCNGTDDGTITISNPAGGYGTYEYSIDGGATWTAGLTNTGLAPGTYDVQKDVYMVTVNIDELANTFSQCSSERCCNL